MPLIAVESWTPTPSYRQALRFIVGHIDQDGLPDATREVLGVLKEATDEQHLDSLARACLGNSVPPNWQGEVVFAVAALQVEFARIAALLDKAKVEPLDAKGVCPICGSAPVAGVI